MSTRIKVYIGIQIRSWLGKTSIIWPPCSMLSLTSTSWSWLDINALKHIRYTQLPVISTSLLIHTLSSTTCTWPSNFYMSTFFWSEKNSGIYICTICTDYMCSMYLYVTYCTHTHCVIAYIICTSKPRYSEQVCQTIFVHYIE